jgi:hypothetical protein
VWEQRWDAQAAPLADQGIAQGDVRVRSGQTREIELDPGQARIGSESRRVEHRPCHPVKVETSLHRTVKTPWG